MTMRWITAVALAAMALPVTASAQPVEEKNLLSGKAAIEPDSGYLFLRAPVRQMGLLLRLPDAKDVADYEQEWAEALAKVKKKYPSKIQAWQRRAAIARGEKRPLPEKPIEPTEENFSIGPIEFRGSVPFGPQFVFAKGKDVEEYSYLTKLRPGRYAYYGPVMIAVNGGPSAGFCYCMGTVAFEVKPGVITDAGNFFLVAPGPDPDFPTSVPTGGEAGLYRPQALSGQYGALAFGLPETLRRYPNAEADFRAYGKLDNVYGVTVGRMPPVPGVLAYDRDRIIDLKAPAPAPAPIAMEAATAGE